MAEEFVLEALDQALLKGTPQYHHSEQGIQYCANGYVSKLEEKEVQISMSDKGEPTQNPFIESFFRTLKVEEVYMMEYETIEDAKSSIKRFIEIVYTKKRLHSSLGYLTPEEFERNYIIQQQKHLILENQPDNEAFKCAI